MKNETTERQLLNTQQLTILLNNIKQRAKRNTKIITHHNNYKK